MHDYLFALVRAPTTQNTVWYDSCPILYVVCMMLGVMIYVLLSYV